MLEGKYLIDPVSECWVWQKATKKFGYGYLTIGSRTDGSRKTITAHRLSYILNIGPVPEGKWVLHHCDNPRCINPTHLYAGDRLRNIRDMIERGRRASDVGEDNNNSFLKESDVIAMRKDRLDGRMTYRELVSKYGLASHKSAMQICKGQLWSHIPLDMEPPK